MYSPEPQFSFVFSGRTKDASINLPICFCVSGPAIDTTQMGHVVEAASISLHSQILYYPLLYCPVVCIGVMCSANAHNQIE